MDLFTVNKTTYKAEKPVEGYNSLIWTERWTDSGDFELRTPLVEEVMALLPEDSLCCILQSDEVMWVETHDIQVDDDGNDVLVVKGSSFESFFKKRLITAAYKYEWKTPTNYQPIQAPAAMVYNYLQQTSGNDLLRPVTYGLSPRDLLPNFATVHSYILNAPAAPTQEWWLKEGDLYSQMRDWLIRGDVGIRTIRPNGPGRDNTKYGVQLGPSGAWGNFAMDKRDPRLWVDFYYGRNRVPGGYGTAKRITFSEAQGHITSSSYVGSVKDMYTMAHVSTSIGSVDVFAPEYSDGLVNGYDRKTMLIDGGDVGDQDPVAFIQAMVQKGEIELAKHRRSFIFDGEFSTDPYQYGVDYGMGDTVRVLGRYGFRADMRVTEFVRTEDADGGERTYPTLSLI